MVSTPYHDVPWPSDGINTFYVAHGHLGVRKVVFAIPDNEKAPATVEDTGLWWETITFEANHTSVNVISDGVKVRSLYHIPGHRRPAKTYWPSPMKPKDHPRVARLNRGAKGLPMVKRMRPLVLNDVGMKALSACCYETSEKNKPLVGAKAAPEVTKTLVTGSWRKGYFYFSERLKGLLTVTPCWIKNMDGLMQITGLVLRYGDGRVRTLGVVRLDCLAEPIDVTASAGMSLSQKDHSHVVDIQTASSQS
ncbi:hypothetical protein FAUST_11450 [Fusarium austroamericanum]|uniref:Uncharacterized protein n=1 Tax=Fusarium austroamericanum TaxID=282268 RepID=A0AAN5YYU1_FUSAU|nr:hypothetical protein FAUST_11450 [Fusarium austroamericanum]